MLIGHMRNFLGACDGWEAEKTLPVVHFAIALFVSEYASKKPYDKLMGDYPPKLSHFNAF